MMRRLRLLFAVLLIVAIPLQGMAAGAMLFCAFQPHSHEAAAPAHSHGGGDHATSHHSTSHHADAHHGDGHHGDGHSAGPDGGAQGDAKCSACASCCFGAAISDTPHAIAAAGPSQATSAPAEVPLRLRATPPPDKPPRA